MFHFVQWNRQKEYSLSKKSFECTVLFHCEDSDHSEDIFVSVNDDRLVSILF